MKIVKTANDWQQIQQGLINLKVGFVPTMGALHEGHISLIRKSKQENDITVASIFVNPMQFNNQNDFNNYPMTLIKDEDNLRLNCCDYLFLPDVEEIYPENDFFKVTENHITTVLCGPTRPGHFDGVATVVLKLLNLIAPNTAYFGEKDYQQLTLIKAMVKALFLKVKISAEPTVRDEYGLALSSRNARLTSDQLTKAREIASLFLNLDSLDELKAELKKFDIKIDYIEDLWGRRFIAYFIGDVRLIDNRPITKSLNPYLSDFDRHGVSI